MSNSDEIRESLLVEAMEKLKSKAKEAIDDVMGDLYVDYLPHVLLDTEINLVNLVDNVIHNMIAGRFEKDGDYARVSDGKGHEYLINFGEYSHLVGPVCERMKDVIVSSRIIQLEQEVAYLKQEINRHFYPRG